MSAETISALSIVINVILIVISVALVVASFKERARRNAQVKIWQQNAQGINAGLRNILTNVNRGFFSDIHAIANVVDSLEPVTFSLYWSLYEERSLTEREYKESQRKMRERYEKQIEEGDESFKQLREQQMKKSLGSPKPITKKE